MKPLSCLLRRYPECFFSRGFALLLFTISLGVCSCIKENHYKQSPASASPDIYLAGSTGDGIHPKATYWKNGQEVILTDGTQYAEAISIVVSGADVYVAGYVFNGSWY